MSSSSSVQNDLVRRRLRLVRWVALADLVLLVVLVASSLSGNRPFVRVLGPLHGANFLLLLTIVGTAAADGLWSWWFPAGVLVTGGPLGALIGEWAIGRRLAAASPPNNTEEATAAPTATSDDVALLNAQHAEPPPNQGPS